MKHPIRMFALALAAGLLLTSGCGKQDSDSPRFNETLGDSSAGVPIGTGPIDEGILKDTKSYQPADYEPLVETQEAEGGMAAGSADEGEEARAVRDTLRDGLLSLAELDLAGFLDAFIEDNIAALRADDCLAAADSFVDTLESMQDAQGEDAADTKALPDIANAVADAVTITVLDEETATAVFDIAGSGLLESIQEEIIATEAGADTANANMSLGMLAGMLPSSITIELRKLEDGWRIDPRFTLDEKDAALLTRAFTFGSKLISEIAQKVAEEEDPSPEDKQAIANTVVMQYMAEIMGLRQEFQTAIADLQEQMNAADEATTGDEGAPSDENAGDADAESESPARRPNTEADPNGG